MDEEIDSKYEFNAPKFIDFLQDEVDQDTDKWFDERDGDEGGIHIDFVSYYEKALGDDGFQKTTAAISAALTNDFGRQEDEENNEKENETDNRITSDEAMDCDDNTKTTKVKFDVQSIKQEKLNVKDIKKERVSHIPAVNNDVPMESEDIPTINPGLPNKITSANEVSELDIVKKIKKERVSHMPSTDEITMEDYADHKSKETNINEMKGSTAKEPIPTNPVENVEMVKPRKSNCRTSWSSPNNAKQPVFKNRRSQPQRQATVRSVDYCDSKKRKKTTSEDTPVFLKKKSRMDGKPTIPETPSFVRKLRERGVNRGQSTEAIQLNKIKELQKKTRENMKMNGKNLKQALRAGTYQPSRSICPVTKPKEFHFSTDTRVKDHSMQTRADAVKKPFENQLRQHPPSPTFKKELTKPKPFNFVLANKPSAIPKQKWESMAQKARDYQIRTPERFKIKKNENGSNVEKKPNRIHVTNPKTPLLLTKTRQRPVAAESAKDIEEKEIEAMSSYQFKATEFNPKIVEKGGMYGVKHMPEPYTTQVKPFRFESDVRLEQRKQNENPDQKSVEVAAPRTRNYSSNSSRNNSSVLSHKAEKPRATEVKPFSFEKRDKERYSKKDDKIKEILEQEEKMHEFHARPLPSFSPENLPVCTTKQTTQAAPFNLCNGSLSYQQKFNQKLQQEAEQEKANRIFKAQNAAVTKKQPYKPVAGLIPVTDITEFNLSSETRAQERAKFENWKHEQEVKIEEEKHRAQQEKELDEEREIKIIRKEAVPKPQPIRSYKSIPQKYEKPLTVPRTPNLEVKKRAAMRL